MNKLIFVLCFISFLLNSNLFSQKNRDGNFWMVLSKNEKYVWLDGYIASSATALAWAQHENVSDKSTRKLLSILKIFDIAKKINDMDLIAIQMDEIYSSKKYYTIELPWAISIVKDKLYRNDGYWEFEKEFYSLPEKTRDSFEKQYYGIIKSQKDSDELIKILNDYLKNDSN